MVGYKHLKTDHNMSTEEYKKLHGEHRSPEAIALLKGRIPHNKGKKLEGAQLLKQQENVRLREEKYASGKLIRQPMPARDEEQRAKYAKGTIAYAKNNTDELSRRAKKAYQTKLVNGTHVNPMKGKKHKESSIDLMRKSSLELGKSQTQQSHAGYLSNMEKCNVTLLNGINEKIFQLQCNKCKSIFSYTHQYFRDSKLNIEMCQICFPRLKGTSKKQQQIAEFIKTITNDVHENITQVLSGQKEIDIFVPSKKLAIEFNGLYWHSEKILLSVGKTKTADNDKRKELNSLGFRYIGIMEDEWDNVPEIVKSRLENLLGISKRVYARKCTISEISSKDASTFCKTNHIQHAGRSNVRYGLYHDNELISVMTFSKSNISRKISEWEINRFCNKLGHTVIGGASRLFKKFINDHNPDSVISYADLRWSEGELYKNLGFVFMHETVPNYWYVEKNRVHRIHRYTLRKTKEDDQSKTEKELRSEQGFSRIYDCGSSKWIWKKGD